MSDQQQIHTAVSQDKGRKRFLPKLGCIVLMTILLGLFVLLCLAVHDARESVRRMQCVPTWIACLFHNYHDVHETFPPAYSTDAEGKPLHSWRVLVLSLMDDFSIGELVNIRLDEPWDSEYNSQFHDKMPRCYYCPSRPAEEQAKGLTPYQMVIGPDTISNGPNSTKLSDVTRNKGDTLLFVEASVSVPWMKPEDLPQSALKNGVVSSVPRRGQPVVQGIGSPHYTRESIFKTKISGANVAMADATCRFFTADMSPEKLLEKSRIRKPNEEEGNND